MTRTAQILILACLLALSSRFAVAAHAERPLRTFGQGRITQAAGIAVDPVTQSVYVTDLRKCHVLIFDHAGKYIRTFGKVGKGPGQFLCPQNVVADGHGSVFVTDSSLDDSLSRVERFDRQGRFLGQIVLSPYLALGLAAHGPGGTLAVSYLSDGNTHIALYHPPRGTRRELPTMWDSEGPSRIAADPQGVWVTALWDMQHARLATEPTPSGTVEEQEIVRLDSRGNVRQHAILRIGGLIAGIASDASDRLYIAERVRDVYELGPTAEHHGQNRVLVYDRHLRQILWFPIAPSNGLAVDDAHVYVAGDHAVQVFRKPKA